MSDYRVTAQMIATQAHAGQVDKAGRPYIQHPARVAAAVAHLSPVHIAAAWLHDVVEDSEWTVASIRTWCSENCLSMPIQVTDAVEALTKRPGEDYLDAVRRAAANPIARAVKLADNFDNSAEERLALLDETTAARLRRKYAVARVLLEEQQ